MQSSLQVSPKPSKVNLGMPEMPTPKRAVSRFEFWPAWFFYAPVVVQSLYHGVKYGGFSLPLIANPNIYLSGMVGESKADILSLAGPYASQFIPQFIRVKKSSAPCEHQVKTTREQMYIQKLNYPVVAKPDKGCRGVGVRLIENDLELQDYIRHFPENASYLLQKKSQYHAEAGIFYIRHPDQKHGEVFSITLKYSPYVVGDGVSSLRALIQSDPRASQLAHLYLPRHQDRLEDVITLGEIFQLAFAGSHSLGCIFKNGNRFISDALVRALDRIFDDYPGYHFGRLDVKFKDIDTLMEGKDFEILEMNGASSEAGHIWDSDTPLSEIFKTLLKQYQHLYQIGAKQKAKGHQVPPLKALWQAYQEEKALMKTYPSTD